MPPLRPARIAAPLAIALVAALAALVLTSLPPKQVILEGRLPAQESVARVRGAYHVHTTRSDGTGTVEEVARAAGRARLDFLILTDHGDATRTFDPPRYVGSVLVIDAVEVSTRLGHVAVIGLPRPAPYRLAGWPDEVLEDTRRMGGIAVATHPDSPRRSLSWRDWTAPLHGFEWLNADTEWRDESRATLARLAAAYPWRPVESIASVFDRPDATLARWDTLSSEGRFLFALAGADAHARLGFRDEEEEDGEARRWALKVPDYEHVFRAFSTVVELDRPFRQRADEDAARLIEALARGRSYTVIDGLARPGRIDFTAEHPGGVARLGDRLDPGVSATFKVKTMAPAGAEVRLLRNGEVVAVSTGLELAAAARTELAGGERGIAFRVEVSWPGADRATVPWILTNPIFVQPAPVTSAGDPEAGGAEQGRAGAGELAGIDLRSCVIEKDPVSSGSVSAEESGDDLRLTYGLGESASAWVALACTLPRPLGPTEALSFRASSSRPVRLGIHLRAEGPGDHRWGRSAFVAEDTSVVTLAARTFRGVSGESGEPLPERPLALLFVLDRVHGVAGMSGSLRLERLRIVNAPGTDQVRTVSRK